jgi:hypothetical protein
MHRRLRRQLQLTNIEVPTHMKANRLKGGQQVPLADLWRFHHRFQQLVLGYLNPDARIQKFIQSEL